MYQHVFYQNNQHFLLRPSLQPAAFAWKHSPTDQNEPQKLYYGYSVRQWLIYALFTSLFFMGSVVILTAQVTVTTGKQELEDAKYGRASLLDVLSNITSNKDVLTEHYAGRTSNSSPEPSPSPSPLPSPVTAPLLLQQPASVIGDPHFVGFDGTSFDFHGESGSVFCIISETNHVLNALLDDLGQGPEYTFIKAVGLKVSPTGTKLNITVVGAGRIQTTVDNAIMQPIYGRLKLKLKYFGSIEYAALGVDGKEESVTVTTDVFKFTLYVLPEQLHINLKVQLVETTKKLTMHGVLGQSYNWVLGEENGYYQPEGPDSLYKVSDLFAEEFTYNKYVHSVLHVDGRNSSVWRMDTCSSC